ncbi:hypothetical protein [Herbidospora galbida]|uniref:hypothetical protein n=1 Tax=Herbidospora galbida TaxID=2575442 RepID=UPI001BB07F69|nr:hypothetical protein [Herbidospora galbida]
MFAYVDIFGFYRADVINGVFAGEMSGTGFAIDRFADIVVSLFYVVTAATSLIGEKWLYYIAGTLIEIALLLAITRVAWTWPTARR